MARADFRFSYTKRVRFAEIDAQAVVFNSRYLEYFDIGVTEYWRTVGVYDDHAINGEVDFHVAKALVEFRQPVLLDEQIEICVRCVRIGRTSVTFAFEIHGAGKDDLRATGEEVSVHVAKLRGSPAPVPDWFAEKFEAYENRPLRSKE